MTDIDMLTSRSGGSWTNWGKRMRTTTRGLPGRPGRVWWALSLVLIVALTACEGGYMITRHSKTCRSANGAGLCQAGIGSLKGTYDEEIDGVAGDAVRVRVNLAVEQGQVNVSVESPEGDVASVAVTPQNPAVLEGVAAVDFDMFAVTFEAVDEEVNGLSYTLEYGPAASGELR